MDKSSSDAPKKAYHKPRLRVYGDIRELTETNPTGKGKPDGAKIAGKWARSG